MSRRKYRSILFLFLVLPLVAAAMAWSVSGLLTSTTDLALLGKVWGFLKYHHPVGYACRFQSKWRAAKYSRNDPASVRLGRRSIAQRTGGRNTISNI